jgi:hypothetical protein
LNRSDNRRHTGNVQTRLLHSKNLLTKFCEFARIA